MDELKGLREKVTHTGTIYFHGSLHTQGAITSKSKTVPTRSIEHLDIDNSVFGYSFCDNITVSSGGFRQANFEKTWIGKPMTRKEIIANQRDAISKNFPKMSEEDLDFHSKTGPAMRGLPRNSDHENYVLTRFGFYPVADGDKIIDPAELKALLDKQKPAITDGGKDGSN